MTNVDTRLLRMNRIPRRLNALTEESAPPDELQHPFAPPITAYAPTLYPCSYFVKYKVSGYPLSLLELFLPWTSFYLVLGVLSLFPLLNLEWYFQIRGPMLESKGTRIRGMRRDT